MDLSLHVLMGLEHSAWTDAMTEWKRLGLPDINDPRFNPLVRALEKWGERIAALRREQPAEDCEKWLDQAVEAYDMSGNDEADTANDWHEPWNGPTVVK